MEHSRQNSLAIVGRTYRRSMQPLLKIFTALFLSLLFSFVACTGNSKSNRPGGDADGTLGLKPRDFFRVESPTKITIVRVYERIKANKYFSTGTGALKDLGAIPIEKIQISLDEVYLTILGEPGIYEHQTVQPELIGTPGNSVQPTTLDAYCITGNDQNVQFASAFFKELSINVKNPGYQMNARSSSGVLEILGGEGAIATRLFSTSTIDYPLAGHGTLSIFTNSPTPEDPNYLNTSITNLRCRLNFVPKAHTVFVTESMLGNLGGLSGADSLCETRAQSGSQTQVGGNWRAILSEGGTNAKDRIQFWPNSFIVNTQGELVVPVSSDLWGGTLSNAIQYNQNGVMGAIRVWTGSLADGTRASGLDSAVSCSSWTNDRNTFSGIIGMSLNIDANWINNMSMGCGAQGFFGGQPPAGIYCINSAP